MSINLSDAIPENSRHGRFGKYYWGIDFYGNENLTEADYYPDKKGNRPIIGNLEIGDKSFSLTLNECDRLIETLTAAKASYEMSYRLGLVKK